MLIKKHEIIKSIIEIVENKDIKIIAMDGRTASGKTTLAKNISDICDCNIIHMDDFFLTPNQRLDSIYKDNHINVDYKRFIKEVLIPLGNKESFSYKAWDCKKEEYKDFILIDPNKLSIIEGSYCCHPLLDKYYDLSIFLDIDVNSQINRLKARGSDIEMFKNKWIPLEEEYFKGFNIKDNCDICFMCL